MSHLCDDTYAVYVETTRRARKLHTCDACRRPILPGHLYADVRFVFDKQAQQVKRCGACQTTHLHLRQLCQEDSYSMMWPDERLGCGLAYEDEWGEVPDEIAALAFTSDDERGKLLEKGATP